MIVPKLSPMDEVELHLSVAIQSSFETVIMEQVDREMDLIILHRSYVIARKDFISSDEPSDSCMLTNGVVQEICTVADSAH